MTTKQKVVDRLLGSRQCDGCNNDGLFLCENTDRDRIEVQRCDNCERFSSDLDAWKYTKPSSAERKFDNNNTSKELWYRKQVQGLYLIINDADKKEFMITREYVKELRVTGRVEVKGNVEGSIDAGGSVACGDVGGSVDAGGSVTASNIRGDIDAGGSVHIKR